MIYCIVIWDFILGKHQFWFHGEEAWIILNVVIGALVSDKLSQVEAFGW